MEPVSLDVSLYGKEKHAKMVKKDYLNVYLNVYAYTFDEKDKRFNLKILNIYRSINRFIIKWSIF